MVFIPGIKPLVKEEAEPIESVGDVVIEGIEVVLALLSVGD